ncbi:HTH_XRE [Propionibacterium ruminifibrarum]|uniref:HTH_XRE n=1 Tax=Propionibacterium ruminifibrarum TaxID=1962131 RepID=A0A375I1J0_9ACTN|nr:helix-turn-helix transcriptional regulator [Propionibacterium ruminifibrarum]SPF68691.1 HTH_XRE [Propionibacterium ruminifibrarum]
MVEGEARCWAVVIADQRVSRRGPDRVPEALRALAPLAEGFRLGFERTAGDEVQALSADPAAVVRAVTVLWRLGDWHVGVGVGEVELPLPDSTRAARGPAYLAARQAIGRPAAAAPRFVGGAGTRNLRALDEAQTVLALVAALIHRRSAAGWQVIDLVEAGLSQTQAARRLGISPQAVGQRLRAAHHREVAAGLELATARLAEAMGVSVAPSTVAP